MPAGDAAEHRAVLTRPCHPTTPGLGDEGVNRRVLAECGGAGNGDEGVGSPRASSRCQGQPCRKERASQQDEPVQKSRSEKGVVNSRSGVT